MIDRYTIKMNNAKNPKRMKIKYNKLKGISSIIKQIMIERYYDQCKLTYCLKFFEWRKKYIELYLNNQESGDLYKLLSIETRMDQLNKGSKMILEHDLSDDEEDEDKKTSEVFVTQESDETRNDPLSIKNKASASAKKKSIRKPKSKTKSKNIEDQSIELMKDLRQLNTPELYTNQIKSLHGTDLTIARAYLAFPPQMKFVPDETILEKLILNATKYRYVKDIPKIL